MALLLSNYSTQGTRLGFDDGNRETINTCQGTPVENQLFIKCGKNIERKDVIWKFYFPNERSRDKR